jgi:hypothetical protein
MMEEIGKAGHGMQFSLVKMQTRNYNTLSRLLGVIYSLNHKDNGDSLEIDEIEAEGELFDFLERLSTSLVNTLYSDNPPKTNIVKAVVFVAEKEIPLMR